MRLVQPDVVMFHIGLWHCTLVDLISPESEYWNSIPKATVDVYQIICPKLLAGLLLLGCSGQPLLDEECCALRKILGVLVAEA